MPLDFYLAECGQETHPAQFLHLQNGAYSFCFTRYENKMHKAVKQHLACSKSSIKVAVVINQPSGMWIPCHSFQCVLLCNKQSGSGEIKQNAIAHFEAIACDER